MPANVGDPSRALTVMCPVHPDKVESLKDCLHALKRGEEGPLATGTTHLGRWVVIEQIDDKIILRGSVTSYYLKQLAQETVMAAYPGQELVNEVSVGHE